MKINPFPIALLALICLITSCKKDAGPGPAPVSTYYYPPLTGDTWEKVKPEDLGWDIPKLNETIEYIASNNSDALIILYKGRIVTEKYWNNFTAKSSAKIYSATKSMTAFMVGMAQEKGKLDVNKKVTDYLGAGWSNALPAREIQVTVKHLITMTSGLDENLTYEAAPATKWFYNTTAYHKVFEVLASALNQTNTAYSNDLLWSKIGMQNSFIATEPRFGGSGPTMSCSARDMARFGLMILSDGKWDGTALMNDASYFEAMKSSSQALNPSYGYLWWLNGKSSYILPGTGPSVSGPLMPDAPTDLIAALGYADKKIYVVKSKDLVVVRHGNASNAPVTQAASSFDNEIWKRLSLAIKP